MTESEFRGFVLKLVSFAQELEHRERTFLLNLLARATANDQLHLADSDPELDACARLAYAAWKAGESEQVWISLNPQPSI